MPPVPAPLPVTIVYTVFVLVLVVKYRPIYGPLNFLYFCDIALLTTLVALWGTLPLLASMGAVGILLPQALWMFDFLVRLMTGKHVVAGLTEYMFDPRKDLFLRCLSLFHFWLPIMLFWLVCRWGYDPRAFVYQSMLACVVLVASYLLTSSPTGPAENVNKVFGPGTGTLPLAQRGPVLRFLLTYRLLWILVLMAFHCFLIIGPTHLILKWLVRPVDGSGSSDAESSGVFSVEGRFSGNADGLEFGNGPPPRGS